MPVDRLLPTSQAHDLIDLVRDIADKELAPRVDQHEREHRYPEGLFTLLGRAGLLGTPTVECGGGAQPYEVYLQVLEELAARWASVAVAVSVHTLAAFPLMRFGTPAQRERWSQAVLNGELIGGYSLIGTARRIGRRRPALPRRAHPGRLPHQRSQGLDHPWRQGGLLRPVRPYRAGQGRHLLLLDTRRHRRPQLRPARGQDGPQRRAHDHRTLGRGAADDGPAARRGGPGTADRVRRAGLGPSGSRRLRDGSCAGRAGRRGRLRQRTHRLRAPHRRPPGTGLLARRHGGGRRLRARHLPRCGAAPRPELPYGRQASVAKLVATDAAARVTTDAVQVFGGYGYTRDFPVERYMREAKIMQIFEGTNQIQRLVIGRSLAR